MGIGASMAQWMSPELLVPEMFGLKKSHPTEASDCCTLGMVIYEVLSGLAPPSQYGFVDGFLTVKEGVYPKRPQGAQELWSTDSVWETLELCWKPQPGDRISAKGILQGLEGSSRVMGPQANVGGGVKTSTDYQSDVKYKHGDPRMFSPFCPRLNFNHPYPT